MVILRIVKGEWKQIPQEEKEEGDLYLADKLREKLDFGMKQQKKNNDVVGLVTGDEGSGKSSLAGNIMRYISKDKFDPTKDMIGADEEQAFECIENVKQNGWLMFDEGNVFFLSTETMKREQRDLHKLFSIFRQKNLFVLIVLPSFFRLGTYFALDRSRFMVRTYMKNGERGQFAYYNEKAKGKLYRKGKKEYNIHAQKPIFRAKFGRCSVLETEEYDKFKKDTLRRAFKSAKVKKPKSQAEILKEYRHDRVKEALKSGLSTEKIGLILGMSGGRVRQLRREYNA